MLRQVFGQASYPFSRFRRLEGSLRAVTLKLAPETLQALDEISAFLADPANHLYGPVDGIPRLREVITEKLEGENGIATLWVANTSCLWKPSWSSACDRSAALNAPSAI